MKLVRKLYKKLRNENNDIFLLFAEFQSGISFENGKSLLNPEKKWFAVECKRLQIKKEFNTEAALNKFIEENKLLNL